MRSVLICFTAAPLARVRPAICSWPRGDSGKFSPILDRLSSIGEPDSPSLTQDDSGQSRQESFFTQSERASLADVDERTQRRADRYEEAELGPEIRSGAISGAEA